MRAKDTPSPSPEPQEPLTCIPPSLDEACLDTAKQWPARLSPHPRRLPPQSEPQMSLEITLTAGSGPELGKLLLELALWMTQADQTVDLTEDKPHFAPPQNTQVVLPAGQEMPYDVRILGSIDTTYTV